MVRGINKGGIMRKLAIVLVPLLILVLVIVAVAHGKTRSFPML